MTGQDRTTTVAPLPKTDTDSPLAPAALTRLVWLLWVASLGAVALRLLTGEGWALAGVVAVDGLTLVMWVVVTFFSGVVHSYSRRYMAGDRHVGRFFRRVFGFTLAVMVLVAAQHLALFAAAWLAMGLLMAGLIGHVRGWAQARAAARLSRQYFLASSALVAVAAAVLWASTGATTVSGVAAAAQSGALPTLPLLVAAGALVLAAMVQSALVPFHGWLLGSMTAPTPASALMHAGFVNAGGILLVRFAPVVTVEPGVMLLVVAVGAASAILGKLLKSVQVDVKRQLGCSTVGQMGFMLMQAGLGFFGAAITHLVLHGFYKAYEFLSAGGRVERTAPPGAGEATRGVGVAGVAVTLVTAVAGGAVFAWLTGKGTGLDSGAVLTLLVVVTVLHATWGAVRRESLSPALRYGAVPLIGLPAIAVYAAVYRAVTGLMADLPVVTAPAELSVAHGIVAGAFLLAYLAVVTGRYRDSDRLYVALVNASQPASNTLLTDRGEYSEH
jgi:NAD(P)H-quinone oxidoreductase subunit 5